MDPELVGTPPDDPLSVGTQALGFAVRDIARAVERLESFGCVVHSSGQDPFGARWVSVRDSRSVTLDLVEDLPESMERTLMRHLRITCDDLESSVTWYERLGAAVVDRAVVSDGSFLGISAPVDTHLVRLRLPDEGFELLLVGWAGAISRGRHPALVNHAGLYRAAVAADDTRRTYVDLSGEGWEFSRSPKLVVLPGKDVQDMWISFATDPNGIPIEFVQRPRSAFREDPAGIAIENRKLEL
ncbi:VOC family protein [Rhodococcus wratislaviensis]|uniref:VOC family protein n=1 Tax=Rhodococcus wratislaviensis TaxID=44752 RepID=UPI0036692B4B